MNIYIKRNVPYSSRWNELHQGDEVVVDRIGEYHYCHSVNDERICFELLEHEISPIPEPLQLSWKPNKKKVFLTFIGIIFSLSLVYISIIFADSPYLFWVGVLGFALSVNKLFENLNIKKQ